MKTALLILAGFVIAGGPPTGEEVVRNMHDRYAGKWYHTLTFVQHNTAYLPGDSVERSIWFERASIPGTLRIDFRDGPTTPTGNGILFSNDSQYVVQGDTVTQRTAFIHPLMVLGFDVYAQTVDRTLGQLRQLGFDLATVHEDTWQGRPVWVVGAKAGDLHTRQFWVDRERLVFVRMLEPGRRDTTATTETQFNDYRAFGGGWVSAQVLFMANGQRRWLEEYADIKTDVAIEPDVFDVRRWKETK
ncbi:MAG TPA: hypothetical protein VJ816_13025 [Gemmatimonadales bacterium]|nr:hypothetical protein [Gemmatimonadales bacterium]